MKKTVFLLIALPLMGMLVSCDTLLAALGSSGYSSANSSDPTPSLMSQALKEALNKGLSFAVNKLGVKDGFLGDAAVKILFPPEAQFASEKLRAIGMGNLVDDFETRMNRGAEDAVKSALPIFVDVLTSMSFQDVKNVLLGDGTAATDYFKARTGDALYNAFSPKIRTSLDQVGAAKAWTTVTSTYNAIPLVNKKVETDIVRYATNKAMDGLFKKVAEEELKIRQNPVFRTTASLKQVFGYADKMKNSGGNTGSNTGSGAVKGNTNTKNTGGKTTIQPSGTTKKGGK